MKNRFFQAFACFALLVVSGSCQSFLEVEEKGKTTIPSFLSDPDGLRVALVGTYNKVYAYYDNEFTKYPDVAGNMLMVKYASGQDDGSNMLSQYNFTSDASEETGAVGYIWRRIYEALANANNLIQYEPAVEQAYPSAASDCRRMRGEALFLRALCHFDLCRVYAQPYNYTPDASHLGIPVLLKTPGPDDNVSRNTVAEVYEQVLKDLDEAADCLKDASSRGVNYVTMPAVYALRSRVCLYKEDWSSALRDAEQAIGTLQVANKEDYQKMFFDLSFDGEAVFRLNGADQSGKLKTFYDTSVTPADTLYTLFDEGDIRATTLLRAADGTKACMKYRSQKQPDNQVKRDDPMVLRVSEIYLNAAEAACHLRQFDRARNFLSPILERAVNREYADGIMADYTDARFLDLVKKERVKELCFEGHNFFDLTRWKQDLVREASTNSSVKRINYPSDYFVLPIPQSELNANQHIQPNPTVNK